MNEIHITNNRNHGIILGGDFNITLEDKDIIGDRIGLSRRGREELQIIVDAFRLNDTYREIYKDRRDFTHRIRGIDRAVRLDRFYCQDIDKVKTTILHTHTLNFTDHKAVEVNLNSTQKSKKSAYWKFNSSLLENEFFVKYLSDYIKKI